MRLGLLVCRLCQCGIYWDENSKNPGKSHLATEHSSYLSNYNADDVKIALSLSGSLCFKMGNTPYFPVKDPKTPLLPIPLLEIIDGLCCSLCYLFYCPTNSKSRIISHITTCHPQILSGQKSDCISQAQIQTLSLRTIDPYFAVLKPAQPSEEVGFSNRTLFAENFATDFTLLSIAEPTQSTQVNDNTKMDMLFERAHVKRWIDMYSEVGEFFPDPIPFQSKVFQLLDQYLENARQAIGGISVSISGYI